MGWVTDGENIAHWMAFNSSADSTQLWSKDMDISPSPRLMRQVPLDSLLALLSFVSSFVKPRT